MKSCNGTKQNFCARLRVYLGLALLFFCLGMSGQGVLCSHISLSKDRYALSDTINASIPADVLSGTDCFVDLISPFGEVIVQKWTSDGKVRIPILPTWECGFYELRVYENAASPVLATRIVPILTDNTTDSIPIWDATIPTSPTYPDWFEDFLTDESGNLKGLLLTLKGKPLEKAGVVVNVCAYNERKELVWEGIALSGTHGEFCVAVPKKGVSSLRISFRDKKGKARRYAYTIVPEGKVGGLSETYFAEASRMAGCLGLTVYSRLAQERNYYFYDMRRETLNMYFLGKRIPKVSDWFMSHSTFSAAMRDEHRAVGWNGTSFSMYPPKKVWISDNKYRIHDLCGNEYVSAVYEGLTYRSAMEQSIVMNNPFPKYLIKKEGAPPLRISQLTYLVVLAGHDNLNLVPEEREYIKKYDPIMVYFK